MRANDRGSELLPWAWIASTCSEPMCLVVDCLVVHSPVKIDYPPGVCVYCGDPADTVDHLLPRPWTGDAVRARVAVVPACGDCNNRINDHPSPDVTTRRRIAHDSIRRKYASVLAGPDRSEREIRELGRGLASVSRANNAKRQIVRERLAWPVDALYDVRAFQHSGIEDPYTLGMLGNDGQSAAG